MAWVDESEGVGGPAFEDDYLDTIDIKLTDGISLSGITGGASIQGGGRNASVQISTTADELVGKIGAIIQPYDPERSSRFIQEFT